ncbi:MAG TPA: nuclear transport factor 2 family protein [Solirubrobacterales bacterium]|nr:nuclear transport factor 2 family protein [Solirubrobacterales bacterium]
MSYQQAWRSAGTGALGDLFTEDASYRMSPYEEPVVGLPRISELWERERQGPDEEFEMQYEVVAVEADTAVIRVEVQYGPPGRLQYRDLWVVRFAVDGRCREFEEWPFWPGQQIIAEGGST